MADDELQRLAAQNWLPTGKDAEITILKAEIDRLTAEIEKLRSTPKAVALFELAEENARLRAALANEQKP